MTTILKFTTPTAAGAEVGRRAERYMAEKGCSYQEAMHAVLAADLEMARAYAAPSPRVSTMATKPADTRSQPAVHVTADDEREILDWVLRALKDNVVGSGALGNLTIEANSFRKTGMPAEEAARRAMGLNPHLVSMAKLLLADIRRNAPETALANPGETVHMRVEALRGMEAGLTYQRAVNLVLAADPALKAAYARS